MTCVTEKTASGDQALMDGVRPITLRDRLQLQIAQPMGPKRNPAIAQKPCDIGLFDTGARNQLDLLDFIRADQRKTTNQP